MRVRNYLNSRTGAVTLSLTSNLALILLKAIAGVLTGSISLISEAIHSSTDLVASGIAFFAIRTAARPADRNHPYGHGKAESLSAAGESLLILLAALVIIYESVQRLIHGAVVQNVEWGVVVMLFSSGVNLVVSRHLFRVADREHSPALAADAWNLSADLFTALGVAAGLLLVRLTGIRALDPLIALGVALLILKGALDITRRSMADLMDESLPPADEAKIREILQAHRHLYSRIRTMRTRRMGPNRHAYIALQFPAGVSLSDAHALTAELESDIREVLPNASIVVEAEPDPRPRETLASIVGKIESLAQEAHVELLDLRLSAAEDSWDVEMDLRERQEAAGRGSAFADQIEHALRDSGFRGEIDIQVEPSSGGRSSRVSRSAREKTPQTKK